MSGYVKRASLDVSGVLASFIEERALPGTGIEAAAFWAGVSDLLHGLAPKNRALLDKRQALQEKIDPCTIARPRPALDGDAYEDLPCAR